MSPECFTVSRVARISHVTVRMLHHYDDIGLLVPSRRSSAGYRLYSPDDLQRLRQILIFRQLGFSLEEIRRLLDEPEYDRSRALREQRDLLMSQIRRTEAVIRAVDATLEALEGDGEMDNERMFDGFDEFDPSKYEEEARERWGETESYRESARRTRRYTPEDWARIRGEMDEIEAGLAELLAAGRHPDEAEVGDLAERHRLHIDRWFYPCSHETHQGLAEMYLADPRFREHFDRRREGLAEFVAAAIRANGARAA